jgi:putative endonuclease
MRIALVLALFLFDRRAYPRAVAPWFVYVAECADGSFYTGIARDVAARLAAHDAGRGAKYTRGRGPLRLLATRRCKSEGNALRLERAVKALSREQKRALVASVDAFGALARRVRRRATADLKASTSTRRR